MYFYSLVFDPLKGGCKFQSFQRLAVDVKGIFFYPVLASSFAQLVLAPTFLKVKGQQSMEPPPPQAIFLSIEIILVLIKVTAYLVQAEI